MKYDEDAIRKRKKHMKKIKIIVFVLFIVFVYNICLMLMSFLLDTNFNGILGYKAFNITSNSMENALKIGDIVIVKKVSENELEKNDIISFEKDGDIITHRIVDIKIEKEVKKYVTKGDNNNIDDKYKIDYSNIQGKYVFKIPILGNFLEIFLNSIFVIIIIILIFIFYLFKLKKDEKSEKRKAKKTREDERYFDRKDS